MAPKGGGSKGHRMPVSIHGLLLENAEESTPRIRLEFMSDIKRDRTLLAGFYLKAWVVPSIFSLGFSSFAIGADMEQTERAQR